MYTVIFSVDPFVHMTGTLAIPDYINKKDIDAIKDYIKSNIELADLEETSCSYFGADIDIDDIEA